MLPRRKLSRRTLRLHCETLEPRHLLSGTPLITEFLASNSGGLLDGNGDSSDWVEIYNPTSGALDLAGWSLTDDAANLSKWSFPTTPLAPFQHLVVFASNKTTAGYIDPAGYRHSTFALSAGGEYLGLVMPTGEVVSEFAPTFPAQSSNISYGLDGVGGSVYFNNPTPGTVNDQSSVVTSPVLINEIMYHPASEAPEEEFLELYNTGATTLQLSGWKLTGAVDFTFPSVTLAAGQYLAIAANSATFAGLHPTVSNFVGGWTGKLSNSGESISLVDATGKLIDSVTYTDEGDWADRELGPLDFNHRGWVWSNAHDGGGQSLELVSTALANDAGQSWKVSSVAGGTPGSVNSVHDADSNVAPLIFDVTHFPIIPRSTDPLTISARLIDELTTGVAATLFWRIDGAPTFQTAPMVDSGVGPDASAGDQVFTAQLPAFAHGTVVEYYVQSADAAGNLRTYPAPTQPSGQQLTNLLFQVDDSFDPNNLPAVALPPSIGSS